MYIILTVASAIFLGFYDLFKKLSTKKSSNVFEILFFYTFSSFLLSFIFIADAFSIEHKYILIYFLKACVVGLNWFCTTKAVSKLDLGLVMPFSMLGTIFTIVFDYIIFDQTIGLVQIGGALIILLGLYLITLVSKKEEKNNDYKYLMLMVFAAALSTVSAIIDKKVLTNNGVSGGAASFWFFGFMALIYFVVSLISRRNISIDAVKNNKWIILTGICIFAADLLYYEAVKDVNAPMSAISIIRKLSVFVGIVAAGVVLKEGNLLKKILILLLMFAGLTIIIFM